MRHHSSSAPLPAEPRAARSKRGDWATDPHAAALPVGVQGARARGDRVPGAREGRQRRRAGAAEADRRQPRPRDRRCWPCRSRCSSPTACCACRRRCSPSCASSCSRRSRSARCARSRCRCSATCTRCRCASTSTRQTGGLTRDVERGQRGISTLIQFTLFSILPTLVEIALVSAILIARYDWTFMAITAGALVALHRVHRARSPSGARTSGAR